MSMESNSAAEEPRDRVRLIWLGVIILAIVAGVVLWIVNGRDPAVSSVRVKHILIEFNRQDPEARARAHETITRLRERIANGESFEKLAREYSDDEFSAVRGGDLGWVKRGTLSDNVDNYVWEAPLNTVSDIIETGFGFHLVLVVDRHLSSADVHQKELEERVLREMEEEKEAAPPAAPAAAPEATAAPETPAPEAATPPAPPVSIQAPPGQAGP